VLAARWRKETIMTKEYEVTLTSPAKIAGKREPQGKTLTVSKTVREQLIAAGLVDAVTVMVPVASGVDLTSFEGTDDFETAVTSKAKEMAEALVEAAVDEAVTELTTAADEANARAEKAEVKVHEAEAQLQTLQDRVLELQEQLKPASDEPAHDTADAPTDTSEAATEGEKTTKASPKAGSGKTQKG